MSSPDGRYHLTFNGEIYNYRELRHELVQLGHTFSSTSDTEVLLACLAQWGTAALNRLVGMFAFALVDLRARTVLLARDFFGIKPLYWAEWRGGVAFGSEIKALLGLPGLARTANAQRVFDYLRFGLTDHESDTMFEAVRQVPPAHHLTISLDDPSARKIEKYWSIDAIEMSGLTLADAADRLRELFLASIRLHLRSDVPIGAALSGGVDSSAIVMAMRAVEPDLDFKAFSYIADGAAINEERWVDVVGEASQARIVKVSPTAAELVADLPRLIAIQDEPFASTSIYAQFRVFQLAKDHGVTVMLDGQGADEMFGGYRYYLGARLVSLLRQKQYGAALQFVRSAGRLPGTSPLQLITRAADFALPPNIQGPARNAIGKDLVPRWMALSWFKDRGVTPPVLCYSTDSDALREHLRRTLSTTSLPHLLRYEDRNSMAFSIESRVPFLTPQLAEFALSLPEEFIISPNGDTKHIFKVAMRGLVPDAILNRRDKVGFATPEKAWLASASSWVEAVLKSDAATAVGALNIEEVRRDWTAAMRGDASAASKAWRWINLIEWSRQFDVRFN